MCRSTEFYSSRNRLQIREFCIRFKLGGGGGRKGSLEPFPEIITLHYLPRISETPLDINNSKIRSDSDAFVDLHRVRSSEKSSTQLVYATRERVRVGEAVRFCVYVGEERVLKGIFRNENEWRIHCECLLERDDQSSCCGEIVEAQVSVLGDDRKKLNYKVDMVGNRKKSCKIRRLLLDEIPEEKEREEVEYSASCSSSCCDCCSSNTSSGSQDDFPNIANDIDIDTDMVGVSWAVDVGIWVVCFGVGYFVSKASSKRLLPLL